MFSLTSIIYCIFVFDPFKRLRQFFLVAKEELKQSEVASEISDFSLGIRKRIWISLFCSIKSTKLLVKIDFYQARPQKITQTNLGLFKKDSNLGSELTFIWLANEIQIYSSEIFLILIVGLTFSGAPELILICLVQLPTQCRGSC